jgi:hypothetical protein
MKTILLSFQYFFGAMFQPKKYFTKFISEKDMSRLMITVVISSFIMIMYFICYLTGALTLKTGFLPDWFPNIYSYYIKNSELMLFIFSSLPMFYVINFAAVGLYAFYGMFTKVGELNPVFDFLSAFGLAMIAMYIPAFPDIIIEIALVIVFNIFHYASSPFWVFILFTVLLSGMTVWTYYLFYRGFTVLFGNIKKGLSVAFALTTTAVYLLLNMIWLM